MASLQAGAESYSSRGTILHSVWAWLGHGPQHFLCFAALLGHWDQLHVPLRCGSRDRRSGDCCRRCRRENEWDRLLRQPCRSLSFSLKIARAEAIEAAKPGLLNSFMRSSTERKFHGFWPPVLLETQSNGRIDLEAVSECTRFFADAGVHGIYTADTASEFYTLEFEEWDELATHFRAVSRAAGLPAGVGCTWTNQSGVLRRIARARELGFENIHLSQPYWIKLNGPSQLDYWRAVGEVADSLPIIVYAGSQGQLPLDGGLLPRLFEVCPAIAGTKSTGFDSVAMNSLLIECPELDHFVHETVFCQWMALGAAGCFSSLVALCPQLALRWFDEIVDRNWEEAFQIQRRVNRFFEEGLIPIRKAGYIADKAVFELGRLPRATRTHRPPYASVPDELFRGLEAAALAHLPEFSSELKARGL